VHLGDRLREVREECGLTQEQAAVAAGLTRNALVSLENRRFPDPYLSTLLRLMRVYNLTTIEQLLGPIPSRLLASSWEAEGWRGTRQARTR
jgi:DNA-binding XRE family transcriptional regulator